jgi:hypothetical protein
MERVKGLSVNSRPVESDSFSVDRGPLSPRRADRSPAPWAFSFAYSPFGSNVTCPMRSAAGCQRNSKMVD